MSGRKCVQIFVLVVALLVNVAFVTAVPEYQSIPTPDKILASGVADATGPAGVACVEYWVWQGGNGYYYYSYMIYNSSFSPFIKHLTIGNPTGEEYFVTGSSAVVPPLGQPFLPWSFATYASLPTVIDWVASDPGTVIYPGQTSWSNALFQFASKLPPSSSSLTVREGSLTTYANGIIPAPGNGISPQSTGYWKHQFSGKGNRKEAVCLPTYMNDIQIFSAVFASGLAGTVASDLNFGAATLAPDDSSVMLAKAKRELFGVWLNVTSGKLNYYGSVTYDPQAVTTTATTIKSAVQEIEAVILNPASTPAQLENAKDMAEILNVL
ncbi:MAG: hypothetical protein WC975_01370 [Phycisphaerae bacterium]